MPPVPAIGPKMICNVSVSSEIFLIKEKTTRKGLKVSNLIFSLPLFPLVTDTLYTPDPDVIVLIYIFQTVSSNPSCIRDSSWTGLPSVTAAILSNFLPC